MSTRIGPDSPPPLAIELFQPKPNILYRLQANCCVDFDPKIGSDSPQDIGWDWAAHRTLGR